jgi:hypothetical protein
VKQFERNGWIQVEDVCGCNAMAGQFMACEKHEPDTTEASLREWSERKDRLLAAAAEAQRQYARNEPLRKMQADHDKAKDEDPGFGE